MLSWAVITDGAALFAILAVLLALAARDAPPHGLIDWPDDRSSGRVGVRIGIPSGQNDQLAGEVSIGRKNVR